MGGNSKVSKMAGELRDEPLLEDTGRIYFQAMHRRIKAKGIEKYELVYGSYKISR